MVRHGFSEGNHDGSLYIQKGDRNIELMVEGWRQAVKAGQFLNKYYTRKNIQTWPVLYSSSYRRTRQTLSGLHYGLNGLFQKNPKLLENPYLIEKFFGAMSALNYPAEGMPRDFAEIMLILSNSVYKNDRFTTKPLFGESDKDLLLAVKTFIDGTLRRDMEEGNNEFLIVTHGAVIKAFVTNWAHLQTDDTIATPGNCDIIAIEGNPKKWEIKKIYDGEKVIETNIDLLADKKPFVFQDLPPVPEFIRQEFNLG